MVATLVAAVELREQLLTQERELESKGGTVTAWEDGLAVFECALGRVHTKHYAKCTRAEAIL
jgi:hypothetical protein